MSALSTAAGLRNQVTSMLVGSSCTTLSPTSSRTDTETDGGLEALDSSISLTRKAWAPSPLTLKTEQLLSCSSTASNRNKSVQRRRSAFTQPALQASATLISM